MARGRIKRWRIAEAVARVRVQQGDLDAGPAEDPWTQILWENVAYLADDKNRAEAFHELESKIGTDPKAILAARPADLRSIGSHGILPEASLKKLRACASLAIEEFDGNPRTLAQLPSDRLRAIVRKFPGIGVPSADRILLYARRERILPLDSNGLRVVLRLGYGKEDPSYSRAYASVREALAGSIPSDFEALIEAHKRLRLHGKSICHRNRPRCSACPISLRCPSREDVVK